MWQRMRLRAIGEVRNTTHVDVHGSQGVMKSAGMSEVPFGAEVAALLNVSKCRSKFTDVNNLVAPNTRGSSRSSEYRYAPLSSGSSSQSLCPCVIRFQDMDVEMVHALVMPELVI